MRVLKCGCCLVALLIVASSAVVAQERPDCGVHPGACFLDSQDFPGILFLADDPDGDAVEALIPASSDDFFSFLPDGTLHIHAQDTEVELTAYPATGGVLTGSARLQANWTATPIPTGGEAFCPITTNLYGLVTDGTSTYEVTEVTVLTRTAQGDCRTIMDDIKIVAQ